MASTSRNNQRTLALALGLVILMVGLGYASVPLYSLFCRVTGFGGTPGVVDAAAVAGGGTRPLTVRFNADIDRRLPWDFFPDQPDVQVVPGRAFLVSYTAHNPAAVATRGTATFNVIPLKAGKYFKKIHCFCFDAQTLEAGQTAHFPVSFAIDPAIEHDPQLREVGTITLSYTFFPVVE